MHELCEAIISSPISYILMAPIAVLALCIAGLILEVCGWILWAALVSILWLLRIVKTEDYFDTLFGGPDVLFKA